MAAHYRSSTFTAQNSIGHMICRAHNLFLPQIETLFEDETLTFTQWRVLMSLRDNVATTCADIARNLRHDNGSMTRLADQLEAQGLLSRQRSSTDRRVVHLALTAQGKKTVETLIPRVVDYWNVLLADFSRAETETLIKLLIRLIATGESAAQEPEKQRRAS